MQIGFFCKIDLHIIKTLCMYFLSYNNLSTGNIKATQKKVISSIFFQIAVHRVFFKLKNSGNNVPNFLQ